jgi:hypothetical protein
MDIGTRSRLVEHIKNTRFKMLAKPSLVLATASCVFSLGIMFVGCGGDDAAPAAGGENAGGSATAGSAGNSGNSGSQDKVPPTFAGIKSVSAMGETSAQVTWDAGSDDVSPPTRLAYHIYVSPTGTAIDYTQPFATSPAGDTSWILTGLTPGHSVDVAVRAVDEGGNTDENTKTLAVTTADSTPPKFNGIRKLNGKNGTSLEASWFEASDQGTDVSQIRYRIYVSESSQAMDFTKVFAETDPGVTQFSLLNLKELTNYNVAVRAVDANSNEDMNTKVLNASTLDGSPPIFAGAAQAIPLGTAIKVLWVPATDNLDPPEYIRYEIFQSTTAGTFDYNNPTLTTEPGVTEHTFINLELSTTYYYVVRAIDSSGNRESNTVEVSTTTAASADITAPVFAGVDTVQAQSATSIALSWTAAIDDFSNASEIVYDIYQASSANGEDFNNPTFSTAPGETNFVVKGLKPETDYFFVVRARDQVGNQDTNTKEGQSKTLNDSTPPTFSSGLNATPTGPTTISLTWNPGTDDSTDPSNLTYRIYMASSPGGENFGTPVVVTQPGTTSYAISDLLPNKPYYFVVRATDEAGNEDSNTNEANATTFPDKTAPLFAGATQMVAQGPTSFLVTWAAASDDVTPQNEIVYEVYVSNTMGGQNFANPILTAAGDTSYVINNLQPGTKRFVVVRARDTYGNSDTNVIEVSGITDADTTAPTFAGASGVSAATSTSLTVNWPAASDNVTPANQIQYLVCRSASSTGCTGAGFSANQGTVVGGTKLVQNGLTPLQTYYYVVRARDAANNTDTNNKVVSGSTQLDTQAPTFAGLQTASATGPGTIQLSWNAASDNVSNSSQIVYNVYRATSPGGFNFASPTYTSTAGATTFQATGLQPSTLYYFVVRAQDTAGNEDTNSVSKSATTQADTTAPTGGAATSAVGSGCTSATVNFGQATDDFTSNANIAYQICYSTSSTGCSGANFHVNATRTGSPLNYTFTGLTTETTYYFVVRARDQANNSNTNNTVRSVTLQDTTAPTMSGNPTVTRVLADGSTNTARLNISWSQGNDSCQSNSLLNYRLCWSTSSSGCSGTNFSTMKTVNNTTSTYINKTSNSLLTNKLYYVWVRAVDDAGNAEGSTANHVSSATTAYSYLYDIDTIFQTASASGGCAGGCHSPLWNYSNIVTNDNTLHCSTYKLIVPGNPSQSYLYRKMYDTTPPCGSRMPAGGPFISANTTKLSNWIIQGAHNN